MKSFRITNQRKIIRAMLPIILLTSGIFLTHSIQKNGIELLALKGTTIENPSIAEQQQPFFEKNEEAYHIQSNSYQALLTDKGISFSHNIDDYLDWKFSWPNESAQWKEQEEEVWIKEAFVGTDIRLYPSATKELSYDLILAPHSSLEQVQFDIGDFDQAYIDASGRLNIEKGASLIQHSKPYSYQEIEGKKIEVESAFLLEDGVLSFDLGGYDPDYALVIDPTVSMLLLAPCTTLDYNILSNKQMISLSTQMPIGGGALTDLLDGTGDGQQSFFYNRNNNVSGNEILRLQFPSATILTGIENDGSFFLDNGVNYQIDGSFDGLSWDNLTGTQIFSTTKTASTVAPGTTYKFPITGNSTAYTYYRILGISGQTDWNWIAELYFTTDVSNQSGLTNVNCNINSTLSDPVDDYITFDLDPCGGTGVYTVTATGTTIAAGAGALGASATASFGVPTSFRLGDGTAGGGNVTITISGFTDAMDVVQTITDPGNCLPGPCPGPDWNLLSNKQTLAVSANASTSGNINVLLDGNDNNNSFFYPDASIAGFEVLRVSFPGSEVLSGIEYVIGDSWMFDTGATMRVQASANGTRWIDMTPTATNTSPSLEISGNTYVKNRSLGNNHTGVLSTQDHTERFFWENTTSFKYYRILGVSGTTNRTPWVDELYFEASAGAVVSSLGCNDNGTTFEFSDDQLTFDLNPMHGSGTYNVAVDGGFTISPTTGMYGQVTSFTLSTGSAGAGDVNLRITDVNVPCTIDVLIPNTENLCIPGPCGGSDWNDPALKSTITGTFHVPGTGDTEGPIARFVDSDESNFADSKNNDYTNEATFDLQFPEATVLTGIEVVVTGAPISSATVLVEASNDGINYVPLTGSLVFGTDFTLAPAQYGTSTLQGYAFPFANNTTAYTFYRVFAIEMTTLFTSRRWNELYFNYNIFDEGLTNVAFDDNSTPGNFDDDIVSFDLNPTPGTGTYNVNLQGGTYTLTPTTGTYGQVTSFQTSAGAAGTGDLTVTLFDPTEVCVQDITIPNPDFSGAVVEAIQNACTSPTDNPLSSIRITADDATFMKAEFNEGTVYAGTGFATATDVTNASSGFVLVNNLPNPQFDTYYTVRAYSTETLFRDYVVLVQPKVCSVADLQLSVSPATSDANEGEQLTYVVTLTNAGPDPAVNVGVRVDIPAGLELLTTSPTIGDYSPGTQLWTADLVPVGTHQLTVTYRMK